MLPSIIQDYREQGAPDDQFMLIELLKEAQESCGAFTPDMLQEIAQGLGTKPTMLAAIIRRVPALRMADAPHRLELCATCPKGQELRAWAQEAAKSGGFTCHFTPCMKNCKNGPSARWDGELLSHATVDKLQALLHERKEQP